MFSAIAKGHSRKRIVLWLCAAVLMLVLIVIAGVWLLRLPIAEHYVRSVCDTKKITCDAQITRLDLSGITARTIEIDGPDGQGQSVTAAEIDLVWEGFFQPTIKRVRLEEPVIRANYARGRFTLYGVQPLFPENSGTGAQDLPEIPPVIVEGGRLEVSTPAGLVTGSFVADMASLTSGSFDAFLEPARLRRGESYLDLERAIVRIDIEDGRPTGELSVISSSAEMDGSGVSNLAVALDLSALGDRPGDTAVVWNASASSVTVPGTTLREFSTEGRATLTSFTARDPLHAKLSTLSGAAKAGLASARGIDLQAFSITADLARQEDRFSGTLAAEGDVSGDSIGRYQGAVLAGDASFDAARPLEGLVDFEGGVSVENGSLPETVLSQMFPLPALPDPLSAHGSWLEGRLKAALQSFSVGLEGRVSFDPSEDQFDYTLTAPLAFVSRTAPMTVRLASSRKTDLISGDQDRLSAGVKGRVDIGRSFDLDWTSSDIAVDWKRGVFDARLTNLSLAPWTVEDRALSLRLPVVATQRAEDSTLLSLRGLVGYQGDLPGLERFDGTVSADLLAMEAESGWLVKLAEATCAELDINALQASGVSIGGFSTNACAPGGRIFRRNANGLAGRVSFSSLDIPFETDGFSGGLGLAKPQLDWAVTSRGIDLTIKSERVSSAMETEDARYEPVFSMVDISLKNRKSGLEASGTIGALEPGLANLPVVISASDLAFAGKIGADGPAFGIDGGQVQITSVVEDGGPVFEPLVLKAEGRFEMDRLVMNGTLAGVSGDQSYGTLELIHNVSEGAGSAVFDSKSLRFAPDGLQPYDLTEKLRGLAVDTTGQITALAKAAWSSEGLTTSGELGLRNLSFSTFRLGRIEGVSGTIKFTDLLAVESEPEQLVTIDVINLTPDLVLQDGRIQLSLQGPGAARLDGAVWPFAGGTLRIDPTTWKTDAALQQVAISVERMKAEEILKIFKVPDLEVTGTLSGRFPIEIDGASAIIRDARLEALGDGRISYTGQAGEDASTADRYAKLTFDALKNFQYEVLSLTADGSLTGQMMLKLGLAGRNPDVLEGQAFNLNISLDSDLAKLIRSGRMALSSDASRDAVAELVRERQTQQGAAGGD